MSAPGAGALREILETAQARGFLGPGDVGTQLDHARAFAATLGPPPRRFLDLGSGGGLPGLVLAALWPETPGVLLDAAARRVEFLEEACRRLRFGRRVAALQARAEEAARRPELRAGFDLVTARAFGPPAVTAECAAGFLEPGGRLAVSEPPDGREGRWPTESVAVLGFGPAELRQSAGASVALLTLPGAVAERWPRRTGVPAKRPLWR